MSEKKSTKKKFFQKIIIGVIVLSAVIAFKVFDLRQYLTLSYIKASQERFALLYAEHRLIVILGYVVVYVSATSLSLPGAAVLTLACIVSRFILRDRIQTKFSDMLKIVNDGIEKEGAFCLFTLRLIPIFPFWLINLVMGLTKMPLRRFFWVSQVGMLPRTIVYVNAGKELAKIESLSGIISPGLIISFAVLGIFPIAAKKILSFYQRKKL